MTFIKEHLPLILCYTALIAVLTVLYFLQRKKTNDNELKFEYTRRKGIKEVLASVYKILDNIPFTRLTMRDVFRRYRAVFPGETLEPMVRTVRDASVCLGIIAAGTWTVAAGLPRFAASAKPDIFTGEQTFFGYVSAAVIVYSLVVQYLNGRQISLELKFLSNFDIFLSDYKHWYYETRDARKALQAVISQSDSIMRGHAQKILEVIDSNQPSEAIQEYMHGDFHKKLKLLLLMISVVEDGGDIAEENGTVFSGSLESMKKAVQDEQLALESKVDAFRFRALCASVICIIMPYCAEWGQSIMPNLIFFYRGTTGHLLKLGGLAYCFVCYRAVLQIRDAERMRKPRHPVAKVLSYVPPFSFLTDAVMVSVGKTRNERFAEKIRRLAEQYSARTFYCLKVISFFGAIAVMSLTLTLGNAEQREILMTDTTTLEDEILSANSRQMRKLKELVPEYMEEYAGKDIPDRDALAEELRWVHNLGMCSEDTADFIIDRLLQIRDTEFTAKDGLLTLIVAVAAFFFPDIALAFRSSMLEDRQHDEVVQFQEIIHATKKLPGTTAFSMMETMEEFADIFRPSLQRCLVEMNTDERALYRLREEETYAPFRRIVDGFIRIDELGVEKSFDEISAEMAALSDRTKFEAGKQLRRQKALATVFAFTPALLIVFGYLLLPFILSATQAGNGGSLTAVLGTSAF